MAKEDLLQWLEQAGCRADPMRLYCDPRCTSPLAEGLAEEWQGLGADSVLWIGIPGAGAGAKLAERLASKCLKAEMRFGQGVVFDNKLEEVSDIVAGQMVLVVSDMPLSPKHKQLVENFIKNAEAKAVFRNVRSEPGAAPCKNGRNGTSYVPWSGGG